MLFCILWFIVIVSVQGDPTRDFALIYLTRYGYFDGSNSVDQFDDTAFKNAVSQFQINAGLESTGIINEETLAMMTNPRCGFKDTLGTASDYRSKRYALQGSSWRRSNIKYKVSKYPRHIPKKEIDIEVARAFSLWSNHAKLEFTPSNEATDIDIKFEKYEHGDENPFDGKGGVLAHASFPTNGGGIHFDGSEDWGINTTDPTKKDFYRTAAHEIGHALGLGHSDVIPSLMAPFYTSIKSGPLVTDDDIQAIQTLYGTKSEVIYSDVKLRNTILCPETKIDTIFNTRNGDIYIFKRDNYWKLSKNRTVFKGYPKKVFLNWPNLPTPVDAAFTDTNGKTYFFKDSHVWRYTTNSMDSGFPRRISEFFPGIPNNIDGAFIWSGNGKLYVFKGSRYWKCDRRRKTCRFNNYPKPISFWKGIPDNLDGVFHSNDGYTYFFKDENYYKFNDIEFSVYEETPPYPRSMSKWWFGCN